MVLVTMCVLLCRVLSIESFFFSCSTKTRQASLVEWHDRLSVNVVVVVSFYARRAAVDSLTELNRLAKYQLLNTFDLSLNTFRHYYCLFFMLACFLCIKFEFNINLIRAWFVETWMIFFYASKYRTTFLLRLLITTAGKSYATII